MARPKRNGEITNTIAIYAARIKGPLAFADADADADADAEMYAFDPSFPNFYDKNAPISSAVSSQFAEIEGLSVPRNTQPPYILTVGGENAIDLNSSSAPVISTLVAVITEDMLTGNRLVHATPLTTLVFHMAKAGAGTSADANSFVDDLYNAASQISAKFAISQDVAVNAINSPEVINDDTDTLSRHVETVHHRAALEAFAAKVHALARVPAPMTSLTCWRWTCKAMELSIIKLTVSRSEA